MARRRDEINANTGSAGVQSVEIGIGILKVIARANQTPTLSEIAQVTGHSPPMVHRYLASLMRGGLVERVHETGRYDLGPDALAIGFAALGRVNSRNVALDALAKLNQGINKSVVLFIWANDGPVVVGWRESSDPITFSVRLGVMLSPVQSISGRLFLAYHPPEVAAKIIGREFKKTRRIRWEGEKIGRAEFERRLADIRRRGLVRGRSELIVGVDAIGAPVFGGGGEVVYAIVAIGAAGGINVSWNGETARAIRAAAKDLSLRLGYEAA